MKSAMREIAGCGAPPAPRVTQKRKPLSREEYVEGILRGDRTVLARAVTLIESAREVDRALAEQIVEDCLPHSGNSIRVGITGVPGAGKSSLIEALGRYLIAEQQQKVAVLAIDPSSQISGGSILGDKTRMTTLAASEMAFVRPSPSRGMCRRRGAADARGDAAVRSGGIPEHSGGNHRRGTVGDCGARDGGLLSADHAGRSGR